MIKILLLVSVSIAVSLSQTIDTKAISEQIAKLKADFKSTKEAFEKMKKP